MAFQLDTISAAQQLKEKKQRSVSGLLQKEIIIFGKAFSNKKKEHFYTELSVLLKAGVNLKDALSLIEQNEKKKPLKDFFSAVIGGIISGKTFSEVVKEKKEITEYEYYSLQIGEETGTLDEVAASLGRFFSGKNEQRRNVINALTYPVIIFITAVLVVVFMLRFVVPMFRDIFTQNRVTLPAITKFIISMSAFLSAYGWVIVVFFLVLFLFKKAYTKKQWFKIYSHRFILKLPFLGNFMKTVYLTQFVQAMALLSAAKIPVVNSIALVKKMIAFYPLQQALQDVETQLLKGVSLSDSLNQNAVFDAKMVALVKVAEETNKTGFIFERLYQQYSIEVQQRSRLLSTVMEPLIIVFIGALVGIILISMYLPMFKLSSVLG